MSKYIIDIPNGIEWGVVTCRTEDGFYTRDFDSLEELNSDYINEHFGDPQDDAYERGHEIGYQKGFEDGKKFSVGEAVKRAEYDKGLEDAWECVKKLYLNGMSKELFGRYFNAFIQEYSARQAIEMLKAHEQKKDDKIEVGDEVTHKSDSITWTAVVTQNVDGILTLMGETGAIAEDYDEKCFVKTGRHFDIASILEDMRK